MSERALPTQIPLNPCSVAAECVVPPGETLPEGLITGHPVCAKPRWLPRCLPHNGRVVWAPTRFCPRRCDAVHKPGTPSAGRPQLLLSFSTRNSATPAPPPGFVIIPVNVRSAHPSGRTRRNVLTPSRKICNFSVHKNRHGTSMMPFFFSVLSSFFSSFSVSVPT